jgi:hypothetical protein
MPNSKVRFPDIIFWLARLGTYLFIYIVLGILMMDYEDHWDETKGILRSDASMNRLQWLYYLALQARNIINIFFVIYIFRRFFKKRKQNARQEAKGEKAYDIKEQK